MSIPVPGAIRSGSRRSAGQRIATLVLVALTAGLGGCTFTPAWWWPWQAEVEPAPNTADMTEIAAWKSVRSDIMASLSGLESTYVVELNNGDIYVRLGTNGLFPVGRSTLAPAMSETLTHIAHAIGNRAQIRLGVFGHADGTGKPQPNLVLSAKRAEAVARHLAKHGVPLERISFAGKGQSEPVASNDTASGRAANRRIEMLISRI